MNYIFFSFIILRIYYSTVNVIQFKFFLNLLFYNNIKFMVMVQKYKLICYTYKCLIFCIFNLLNVRIIRTIDINLVNVFLRQFCNCIIMYNKYKQKYLQKVVYQLINTFIANLTRILCLMSMIRIFFFFFICYLRNNVICEFVNTFCTDTNHCYYYTFILI